MRAWMNAQIGPALHGGATWLYVVQAEIKGCRSYGFLVVLGERAHKSLVVYL